MSLISTDTSPTPPNFPNWSFNYFQTISIVCQSSLRQFWLLICFPKLAVYQLFATVFYSMNCQPMNCHWQFLIEPSGTNTMTVFWPQKPNIWKKEFENQRNQQNYCCLTSKAKNVWKQIKTLEYHPNFSSDSVNITNVICELIFFRPG